MVVGGNEVEDGFSWPQVEMPVDSPNRELNVSIPEETRAPQNFEKEAQRLESIPLVNDNSFAKDLGPINRKWAIKYIQLLGQGFNSSRDNLNDDSGLS